MSELDYEEVGWIAASNNRLTVAIELVVEGPSKPSTIVEGTGIDMSHVSRALNQLRDRGHIELLVPEGTRKGRIYGPCEGLADLVEAAAGV